MYQFDEIMDKHFIDKEIANNLFMEYQASKMQGWTALGDSFDYFSKQDWANDFWVLLNFTIIKGKRKSGWGQGLNLPLTN